jgi:hypothetical protein
MFSTMDRQIRPMHDRIIAVRLPQDLVDLIYRAARSEDRTVSGFLRHRLVQIFGFGLATQNRTSREFEPK